jgi:hypothetical protein
VLTPTEEHPLDGADIAVIPSYGDRDMSIRRYNIVGRIYLQPAIPRTIYGHPGMRRVCAYEARLARGWLRDKIAADIARCQTQRPQTTDLHMGKVLTDTTPSA